MTTSFNLTMKISTFIYPYLTFHSSFYWSKITSQLFRLYTAKNVSRVFVPIAKEDRQFCCCSTYGGRTRLETIRSARRQLVLDGGNRGTSIAIASVCDPLHCSTGIESNEPACSLLTIKSTTRGWEVRWVVVRELRTNPWNESNAPTRISQRRDPPSKNGALSTIIFVQTVNTIRFGWFY